MYRVTYRMKAQRHSQTVTTRKQAHEVYWDMWIFKGVDFICLEQLDDEKC